MRTVDVERTIAAPIDDVFEWLSDVSNYQRVPLVRRVTLVRPGDVAEHGVGAVRMFVAPFMRVSQEITQYDPPRSVRYRTLHSTPRMRYQTGELTFREVRGGTRVVWHMEFEVGAPVLRWAWTLLLALGTTMGLNLVLSTADRELRNA
jgi:hypothetical protein